MSRVNKMKINLFEPHIDKSEEKAVLNVLRKKFWASGSGIGHVRKFEKAFLFEMFGFIV